MKPSHILAIVVRLFSVFIFLYAVRQSSFLIGIFADGMDMLKVSVFFSVLSVLLPLAAAILFWFFPMLVANAIIRPDLDNDFEPINVQSILVVLVLAMGLYFLYQALVDTVYWLTIWLYAQRSGVMDASFLLNSENKAHMLATAFELAASLVIILKSRSVSKHMLRLEK